MQTKRQPTILDNLFGVFTDIRAGESNKALILALNIFLVMTSYYIVKPVREGLILAGEGAVAKSLMSGFITILLIFVVPAYARAADRFKPVRLITVVTAIFIAFMGLFWIAGRVQVPRLALVFYVWVGMFGVMIVAQFWAFANLMYTSEAGKRLFPIVAVGGNIGAALGAGTAAQLLRFMSPYELLLVAAGLLGISIVLTIKAATMDPPPALDRVEAAAAPPKPESERRQPKPAADGGGRLTLSGLALRMLRSGNGFDLLWKHRYLGFIAGLVFLLNLVNTNGEYILGELVTANANVELGAAVAVAIDTGEELQFGEQTFGDPTLEENHGRYLGASIGLWYANFFFWVNILGILLQLLLVSRLVKYGGMTAGLLMLPLIALGSYAILIFLPILNIVRIGKTAENATDYSVNNTVRNMLLLPTTPEIKLKAKQAIGSFMQRAGDITSTGAVALLVVAAGFSLSAFAAINLGFVCIWIFLAIRLGALHKKLEAGELPELTDEPSADSVPAD